MELRADRYLPLFAAAVGLTLWRIGALGWWQTLLLTAGLLAASSHPVTALARRSVFMFWMAAAPMLLALALMAVFWTIGSPDRTVEATIVGLETKMLGHPLVGSTLRTLHQVDLRDGAGDRYRVRVHDSQMTKITQGFSLAMETRSFQTTTMTYHTEAVGGLLLPRRVVTHLGEEPVILPPGKFGDFLQGSLTVLALVASATPLSVLAWLWMDYARHASERERGVERVKPVMRQRALDAPGIHHADLCRPVGWDPDVSEAAIRQLLDEKALRCERHWGTGRRYWATGMR